MPNGSRTTNFFNDAPLSVEGDVEILKPIQDEVKKEPTPHHARTHMVQPVAGGGGAAIGVMMICPN